MESQWSSNRKTPVETDGDEHERRQVEPEGPEEHEQTTGGVSRPPGHRHVPPDLQRHHDERDDQVGDGQVHDELVDDGSGAGPAVAPESSEDRDVPDGGDEAEDGIDDDGH